MTSKLSLSKRRLCASSLAVFSLAAVSSINAATTNIVVNGDFTDGFAVDAAWNDNFNGGGAWGVAEDTNVWHWNKGANDRAQHQSSGGNPNGYLSKGSDANKNASIYGIFDIGGTLADVDLSFSIDTFNNTGGTFTVTYSIWYANSATASGGSGGFGSLNTSTDFPHGGGNATQLSTDTITVANTTWGTTAVNNISLPSSFPGGATGINSLSDVDTILIGFNMIGSEASTAAGVDNIVLNVTTTAVPEPSSAALIGLGCITLILRRRK